MILRYGNLKSKYKEIVRTRFIIGNLGLATVNRRIKNIARPSKTLFKSYTTPTLISKPIGDGDR